MVFCIQFQYRLQLLSTIVENYWDFSSLKIFLERLPPESRIIIVCLYGHWSPLVCHTCSDLLFFRSSLWILRQAHIHRLSDPVNTPLRNLLEIISLWSLSLCHEFQGRLFERLWKDPILIKIAEVPSKGWQELDAYTLSLVVQISD